jgi:hypothetical protein
MFIKASLTRSSRRRTELVVATPFCSTHSSQNEAMLILVAKKEEGGKEDEGDAEEMQTPRRTYSCAGDWHGHHYWYKGQYTRSGAPQQTHTHAQTHTTFKANYPSSAKEISLPQSRRHAITFPPQACTQRTYQKRRCPSVSSESKRRALQ